MKLEFEIPEDELLMVRDLLASLANQIGHNHDKNLTIKLPNPASTIVSYAYRELFLEKENQGQNDLKVNGISAEAVGTFGKMQLPDWLLNKSKYRMLTISMEINDHAYELMLNEIQDLYPTLVANKKINKNDLIAAAGIAYAHRIKAGQVSVNVTPA